MSTLGTMKSTRGFTLVELMVAIVVAGVVVVSAYALFSNTSRSMYEVDNLSQLNDQARFAAELIARDVRSAGSLSTPNSYTDRFVNPTANGAENPLKDSNFVRAIYMTDNQDLIRGPQANGNNDNTSSDEIILIGAYDYPFTFEISGLVEGASDEVIEARVRQTPRGAWRFARRDPFDVRTDKLEQLTPGQREGLVLPSRQRLMRAIDRNGFMMFAAIELNGVGYDNDELVFSFAEEQRFTFRRGNNQNGFEPASSLDEGYEAALLDAFRFRVCSAADEPENLQLVRERLAPIEVIDDPSNISTSPVCGDLGGGILEQVVVADRVVDFQVWFDCAPPGQLLMQELPLASGWVTPDAIGSDTNHNCMRSSGLAAGTFQDADQVRVAHIRLSLRTAIERANLGNYRFLTGAVPTTTTTDANAPNVIGPLQTFDVDGDPTTASRVVTVQIDLDMPNYSGRVNR